MKKLIIMNGRWKDWGQIYVAANSKMDAARILKQANDGHGSETSWLYEINLYFSIGCWGNSMEGIKPERGAWVQKNYLSNETPVRVI